MGKHPIHPPRILLFPEYITHLEFISVAIHAILPVIPIQISDVAHSI